MSTSDASGSRALTAQAAGNVTVAAESRSAPSGRTGSGATVAPARESARGIGSVTALRPARPARPARRVGIAGPGGDAKPDPWAGGAGGAGYHDEDDKDGGAAAPAFSARRSASGGGARLGGRPVVLGWRVLLVCMLVAGLAGGVISGLAVAITTGDTSVEPVKTLGVGSPAPVTDRRTVAAVAAAALPTVVTVDVGGAGDDGSGGTGSGVIISSDGYILTNNHVIASAVANGSPISVRRYQEFGQIQAQVVGRDPQTDLAVLRIPAPTPLPAATLGQSGSLVVGAPIVAIGAPLGLSGTVTTGVVSALDRNPTVPAENGTAATVLIGAIQIDAAINPGNSGGPLLDALGQVVGINAAIAAVLGHEEQAQSGSIGVGFAIPVDFARSVAQELIATGRATHPYVGASAATVTAGEATATGGVPGARLVSLVPDGAVARAGLRAGDVITRIDANTIRGTNDLLVAARLHRVGDKVTVTYVRGGVTATAQMTLQEQRN
ncbi:S1C family serine protease [Candidatus Frankia alpina]|uniref:S1C family serine protease n=1 Tax=Candidatus Frankia alpina TaxID=2699483 RepID=UPI001F1FDF02|nr:trypsin-like peptidase domain-containing protein [Candidatus Frankia alpina]